MPSEKVREIVNETESRNSKLSTKLSEKILFLKILTVRKYAVEKR